MATTMSYAREQHLPRESPLSALARQSSYTRDRSKGKQRAADDDQALTAPPPLSHSHLAPVSPLLKNAFDHRASLLTTGSRRTDLGIDRSSALYDASDYDDDEEEDTYSSQRRPSDESRTDDRTRESVASARTDDTGPFHYSDYESRPTSSQPEPPLPSSDRHSNGQDHERDSFASFMLGQPREKPSLSDAIPEDQPISVLVPPTPTAVSTTVTPTGTPVSQGRARSMTASGSRNFSRPLRMSDLSPETSPTAASPPRPSHLAAPLKAYPSPYSRSAPASPTPAEAPARPAASAPNSPNLRAGQRSSPARAEGFQFPGPAYQAPPLSRGPSASSSHMPPTPATPQRTPTAAAAPVQHEASSGASQLRSPMTFANEQASPSADRGARQSTTSSRKSAGGWTETTDEDDRRSSRRSSKRSSRWKFWSRRPRSTDAESSEGRSPSPAPTPALPPTVAIGLADVDQGPLVEPRAVWDRASHHRDLSEAERGRQQQQRSPPPQNDARFLSPAYGEAEERLADHHPREGSPASASTKRSHPTRQPSVASYYSVYSLNSDAPPSPTSPAPGQYHTPPQSSQGHSSEENGSPTAIIPSRTAGASMTKAKRSIDLLRPPAGKASIKTPTPSDRVLSPDDPEDCLQLGIACHESGQLERSAFFFERAATLRGGCGTGMLLWGLTLRHGWGCAVDPTRGFAFLQKAAETVVDDLDGVVASGGTQGFGGDKEEQAAKAAKAELVLSIYELGMSFRKGWGVKKDKKMALSYFELASTLGDPDAQQELGFAYLHGKGCKKDKHKAAHYYRLAAAQGMDTFGQQWIWRRKYGGTED